ncbi:hypothetical protein ALC60_05810 [Trachymyrmex zeteki]|uniref:Uncharacterized protein n=1 Tax=Mycetomoellerius zeteki TaxID=64791 RepID=A0A151X429_9HYME|nr:hypothetical protein ALC60_05810 [Trachymyrmex zeteki]
MRISVRFAEFYDRASCHGKSYIGAASFKLLRCNSINYNNPLQNLRNILANVKRLFVGTCQRRERRMYNQLTKIKGRDGEAFIFHSTSSDNGRELKRSTELATFREYSVEVADLWRVVEISNNVDNEVKNSHRFVPLPHISHEAAKIKSK